MKHFHDIYIFRSPWNSGTEIFGAKEKRLVPNFSQKIFLQTISIPEIEVLEISF